MGWQKALEAVSLTLSLSLSLLAHIYRICVLSATASLPPSLPPSTHIFLPFTALTIFLLPSILSLFFSSSWQYSFVYVGCVLKPSLAGRKVRFMLLLLLLLLLLPSLSLFISLLSYAKILPLSPNLLFSAMCVVSGKDDT